MTYLDRAKHKVEKLASQFKVEKSLKSHLDRKRRLKKIERGFLGDSRTVFFHSSLDYKELMEPNGEWG